jgi:hypothetical protein
VLRAGDADPMPDGEEGLLRSSRIEEQCWWTMESPADAHMDLGAAYVIDWPAEFAGEEPL